MATLSACSTSLALSRGSVISSCGGLPGRGWGTWFQPAPAQRWPGPTRMAADLEAGVQGLLGHSPGELEVVGVPVVVGHGWGSVLAQAWGVAGAEKRLRAGARCCGGHGVVDHGGLGLLGLLRVVIGLIWGFGGLGWVYWGVWCRGWLIANSMVEGAVTRGEGRRVEAFRWMVQRGGGAGRGGGRGAICPRRPPSR